MFGIVTAVEGGHDVFYYRCPADLFTWIEEGGDPPEAYSEALWGNGWRPGRLGDGVARAALICEGFPGVKVLCSLEDVFKEDASSFLGEYLVFHQD